MKGIVSPRRDESFSDLRWRWS